MEQAHQDFHQPAEQVHKVTAALGSANQTTRSLAYLVYLLAEAVPIQMADTLRLLVLILQEALAAGAMERGI